MSYLMVRRPGIRRYRSYSTSPSTTPHRMALLCTGDNLTASPPPLTGPRMTRPATVALFVIAALAAPAAAQTKPLITPKDYGKWELLGASRLAPRGDWVAIPISRVNEEN